MWAIFRGTLHCTHKLTICFTRHRFFFFLLLYLIFFRKILKYNTCITDVVFSINKKVFLKFIHPIIVFRKYFFLYSQNKKNNWLKRIMWCKYYTVIFFFFFRWDAEWNVLNMFGLLVDRLDFMVFMLFQPAEFTAPLQK